jgi:hypothetical protein
MTPGFRSRSVTLCGGFAIACPIERAFPLFSPLGEKDWVPGWNPTLLHPPGVDWALGQVFTTQEETGEAVWVVTRLDREGHEAAYARVEPGHYVAQVRVRCEARDAARTDVQVEYTFVGLSDEGNATIAAMSEDAYVQKMTRWREAIEAHLRSSG